MIQANYSFPVFTVEKIQGTKSFYCNNFSFSVMFEIDWYLQQFSPKGTQLAFMSPEHPTQPEIIQKQYDGNGVILSFDVDNVDSAYEHARKNFLDIVYQLTSEDRGQPRFNARNPNAIYIYIFQLIEPSEEYKLS